MRLLRKKRKAAQHHPGWPSGEPQPVRTAADTPRGQRMNGSYRPGGDSSTQADSDGYHGQGC